MDSAEKYYRLGLAQAIREDQHFFIAVTHQGLAAVAFQRKQWAEAEAEAKLADEEYHCPQNPNMSTNAYRLNECYAIM